MKKAALIFASLVLALSCTACTLGDKSTSSDVSTESSTISDTSNVESIYKTEKECDFALITDSKGLEDQTNMNLWKSIISYGDSNSKTYQYFTVDDIEANGEAVVAQAIDSGARIVVLPSSQFKNTAINLQDKYPEVTFLLVNTLSDSKLSDNVHCINFKEEHVGYFAGYFSVLEGYTTLGFIGDGDNDRNMRYVYGFIQGADDATQELRIHDVTVKYTFIKADVNEAKTVSKEMYKNGIDVIFACNSKIIDGVADTAKSEKKKLVCGEKIYDQYGDVVLTSVAFDTVEAVDYTMKAAFDKDLNWLSDNDSKDFTLGIENGCINLPTDEALWNFEGFNSMYYEEVCQRFVNGEVAVSGATDTIPPIATVVYSYKEYITDSDKE